MAFGLAKIVWPAELAFSQGIHAPAWASILVGIAELALGLGLILTGRRAMIYAGALVLSAAVIVAVIAPVPSCGCLGAAVRMSPNLRVLASSVLLGFHALALLPGQPTSAPAR